MQIACQHISANCAPKANSLKFVDKDTIAFAYSNSVALYSLTKNTILLTLHDSEKEHNRVNCVAVLTIKDNPIIFCGYDSGYLVAFAFEKGRWIKKLSLKEDAALISIQIFSDLQSHHIFTNNNSSVVSHYSFSNDKLMLCQQFKFPPNKLINSMCAYLRGQVLMLFLGGSDQFIHYYEKESNAEGQFAYKCSLQGHQNAITKLIMTEQTKGGDLLLASASKDGYVRLWRITSDQNIFKLHKNVYTLFTNHFLFLDSVLSSHQSSVTSLAWIRTGAALQIASSSLDCTLCLWSNEDGPWSVATRLGQLLGNKNAYFQVLTDVSSSILVALNYTGAIMIWKWTENRWVLRESCNGHADEVRAIQWNHSGHFLVSVSKDQTTRVIAKSQTDSSYHQISRAQVHGYDINAVTLLKIKENTFDVIVCGADQKVIRVLEPPACFANYLNTFTQANLHLYFPSQQEQSKFLKSKPHDSVLLYETYSEGGAQVLGLMTKMQRVQRQKITTYFEEEEGQQLEEEIVKQGVEGSATDLSIDFSKPPHEDYLMKHTLWPEIAKLYGHPHQIQTLCRSNSSKFMASSCKALNKQSASIIIWSVADWKIHKVLNVHNYSVYALQFSLTDKFLASGSKDRKLAVYSQDFSLIYSYEAHSRAITSLSFHPSEQFILTGSRDKTIKLHSISQRKVVSQFDMKQPVSAISFCKLEPDQDYFGVGCVNGDIFIGKIGQGSKLILLQKVEEPFSHSAQITSLKWMKNLLASSSKDFSVRIFQLSFQGK